jgi:hypothetical protein
MEPKNLAVVGVATAVAAAVAASVVFGGGTSTTADAGVADAGADAGHRAPAAPVQHDCPPTFVFNGRDCEAP